MAYYRFAILHIWLSMDKIEVRGARTHNLQNVDVDIPLGVLVAVTGVAGSGKSSLIHGSVAGREGVVAIDQSAIKGSRRSSPGTYTGMLDPIRKAFAKANGVKPALFSANSDGACPVCKGSGVIVTQLGPMEQVETPCDVCEGKGFDEAVLVHLLGARTSSRCSICRHPTLRSSSARARRRCRRRPRS